MKVNQHDAALLRASGLFDSEWYVNEYPDVLFTGFDPFDHFLAYGALLGRSPGPDFDSSYYLNLYPDVAADGVAPVLHYVKYGRSEGRSPRPERITGAYFGDQVDVVIPVFNALDDVKACLESVKTHMDSTTSVRVIVVNDGSDTATTCWLRDFCATSHDFLLVENDVNLGYTLAANIGLKRSTARYVALLNSDTIVVEGWLKRLVGCVTSSPDVGIAGPLSNAASWQNVPELFAGSGEFAINGLPRGIDAQAMGQLVASVATKCYPKVPFLNGFCMLIKRDVLDAIGYLDAVAFPLGYGEENDFCLRASQAGYRFAIADDVYVFHAKSRSFGHERRKSLSKLGTETLRRKHSDFDRSAERARRLAEGLPMSQMRERIRSALADCGAQTHDLDPLACKILFLLPVKGGSGGANSVIQEAAEMRRLGVDVRVAVRPEHLDDFLAKYSDIAGIGELLLDSDDDGVLAASREFDVVVGTIFTSIEMLKQIAEAWPWVQPAYYIQDYEPYFFVPGSAEWGRARGSYNAVPNAILYAKTQWIANTVAKEHGLQVAKVLPSIDHSVFKPVHHRGPTLRIAAMIRPSTKRRGADRTIRVLSSVLSRSEAPIEIHVFGCTDSELTALQLPEGSTFVNHGVLNRCQVADLLGGSDLFVDLSDYQAFGRSALEAMAAGCAVAVPAAGGADEFAIDGVNALVLDTFDEGACVDRISALVSDRRMLARMKTEALTAASRYSLTAAAVSELRVLVSRRPSVPRPIAAPTGVEVAEAAMPLPFSPPQVVRAVAKLPLTVLVISWDVGHNPVGRSYMLAEVLDRVVRNVVQVGFQFPRYGTELWEPIRDSKLPVIAIPGGNFPEFAETLRSISERVRPDLVIACKPRLPSVQLAAMIKERVGCPVILDIDDHELSFFPNEEELAISNLEELSSAEGLAEPYGEFWTRLCQSLRHAADDIIVSNVALQREFGGCLIPHVRDETVFDPTSQNRASARQRYGIPSDAKVVLFFGTPRLHKGLDTLADAVRQLSDEKSRLVIVGSVTDKRVTAKLDSLAGGRIIYLPNQPFSAVPEVLSMADLVCLPQDETSRISRYQLPAKAIDAIAMGVPLLVSCTEPMMQLVKDGVATACTRENLVETIERVLGRREAGEERDVVRSRFLNGYSYAAAENVLRDLIKKVMSSRERSETPVPKLVAEQRRLFGRAQSSLPVPGVDVILFWKQNDSGLYGRRHDMVIKYLASRPDVRKVLVFDAPVSEFDLLRQRNDGTAASQSRWIYRQTYEKKLGLHDTDKVSYNVFIYPPGKYASKGKGDRPPSAMSGDYCQYIEQVARREGVELDSSVFWVYPKNNLASDLIQRFGPSKVVVDVVDDHRAWPGVSDAEVALLTENYRGLLRQADMAFANCEAVRETMSEYFPGIRLVPNGCEENPVADTPVGQLEFERFSSWSGKTIGFVGNLEAKIDVELIEKLAERFPDCQIALIGSTHANPGIRDLQRFSNVLMPGVVPYREVGAWLKKFDVAIVPHLDIPLTKSMNPLKIFVYLAWGIPVVSTEVQNVDRENGVVHVASSHEEFIEKVERALVGGKSERDACSDYVARNSWTARFSRHVDELFAQFGSEVRRIDGAL